MAVRQPTSRAPRPKARLPEPLLRALGLIGLLSAVAATLSLGYLLFLLLSGYRAWDIVGGTHLDRITRNLHLAKGIFVWSLWLLVIVSMIRHYRTDTVSVLVALAGAVCWLLLPAIVAPRVSTHSQQLQELGRALVTSFKTTGQMLMVVGLLRLVIGRAILLSTPARGVARLPGTAAAADLAVRRAAQRPSLMRRCWELQYCRGSLRSRCPRFLEGVACWKRRSGCYCDQGLATRLLAGVGARSRVEVAEELEAAQRRSQHTASRPRYRLRAASKKRPKAPCGECPIYLDHQTYKYRVISWLAYPAAAGITGLLVDQIRNGYGWVDARLGHLLGVHIASGTLTDYTLEPPAWSTAENVMVVLVGIFIVGILLQLIELGIFRFKL